MNAIESLHTKLKGIEDQLREAQNQYHESELEVISFFYNLGSFVFNLVFYLCFLAG